MTLGLEPWPLIRDGLTGVFEDPNAESLAVVAQMRRLSSQANVAKFIGLVVLWRMVLQGVR